MCVHIPRTVAASPAVLYPVSGVSLEKTLSLGVYGVTLTEVHETELIICKPALKTRFHLAHAVLCLTIKSVCFLSMCNNWPTHPKERSRFFAKFHHV